MQEDGSVRHVVQAPGGSVVVSEDDLDEAIDAMEMYQVRRIPVVDDNHRIIGIIAQADIATRVKEPETTAAVVEEISKSATA
jgi:CBS domain-containing protein